MSKLDKINKIERSVYSAELGHSKNFFMNFQYGKMLSQIELFE